MQTEDFQPGDERRQAALRRVRAYLCARKQIRRAGRKRADAQREATSGAGKRTGAGDVWTAGCAGVGAASVCARQRRLEYVSRVAVSSSRGVDQQHSAISQAKW